MRRWLLLLPLLFLSACAPSRDTADSKLAAACAAGVKATFTDEKENITAKDFSFAFQKAYDGSRLRIVTLKADYTYGTSDPEPKTYTCAYAEEWSLFSWLPEFYNLQRDNDKFGNFGGAIVGDPVILAKISDVSDKALH
jgi:hypothetical protein